MPQTNLQIKTDYYKKVIEEGKNSPHYEKYNAVCIKLENLVNFSEAFNQPDKIMSEADFVQLSAKYNEVKDVCRTYLEAERLSEFEKSRAKIIKDIYRVLNKDIAELEKCDAKQPGSLSEIIDRSRRHTIVINSNEIKTMGAALSSRIPLKTSSGKRGFFTPDVSYNPDAKWDANIDKLLGEIGNKYPDCKRYLEALKTDSELREEFLESCPYMTVDEYIAAGREEEAEKKLAEMAAMLNIGKYASTARKMFNSDESLKKVFTEFANGMVSLKNQMEIMEEAGIKKGTTISGRNCAMTDMAKLLGCEGLLANSSHMTIIIDGKPVKGVFMETVDGTDINRLKEDDLILNSDSYLVENAQALSQVTDLQVLDFICGNVDRHMGNMIYDVRRNKIGKAVLTGIKGIDNDCSFGTPDVSDGKRVMRMVNVDKMQFIRESMVKKLDTIKNKSMLSYRLSGNGLTKEEIDAAWDRLKMVKKAAEKGVIKTIPDNHWESEYLMGTDVIKGNYLSRMKRLGELAKETFSEANKIKEISYVTDISHKKVMFDKVAEIEKFREKMNNAKAMIYNSSEYALMEKRFKTLETLNKQVKECGAPENISDELAQQVTQAYTELAEKTNSYIKLKSLIPSTVRGQKRIEFALGLLEFAGETLKEMTPGKDIMDEVKREEPSQDMDVETEKEDVFSI